LKRDLDAIAGERYDLVVVGGGIIGTGTVRDATLRGIKTLLLEKEDFSYGTTSRSSRLIHGGLRYLRHFEFKLVRQDMREREVLLHIAPHLVHPLPFMIPINSLSERLVMMMGMRLYDILSFDKTLPSYHYHSRRETLEMEPNLEMEGLKGSYIFYDCQIPFTERLCVENVISAAGHGASIANHARLVDVLRDGDTVTGVQVEDTLSREVYRIKTRMVVNAAGPWMDLVHGMINTHSKPMLRRTKGVHLLTPRVSNNALVLFARKDGRLFFVIPWEGYSIIGTTDTDYGDDSDTVRADKTDVDYLLTEAQRSFPDLKQEDIFYTFAGLRALAGSAGGSTSNVTRSHRLIDHENTDGIKGFISVIGGKITGFRAIAQEVVDLAAGKLGVNSPCLTAETPLPGTPALTAAELEQTAKESGLSPETVAHLNNLYGSRLLQVIEVAGNDDRAKQQICPHSRDIIAQIRHAVQSEEALTVSDFLLRRSATGLASCQGVDAVETVAEEMAGLLGWSTTEQKRQIEEYRSFVGMWQYFRE